eukprot:Gb_33000 [translate_table: standard]
MVGSREPALCEREGPRDGAAWHHCGERAPSDFISVCWEGPHPHEGQGPEIPPGGGILGACSSRGGGAFPFPFHLGSGRRGRAPCRLSFVCWEGPHPREGRPLPPPRSEVPGSRHVVGSRGLDPRGGAQVSNGDFDGFDIDFSCKEEAAFHRSLDSQGKGGSDGRNIEGPGSVETKSSDTHRMSHMKGGPDQRVSDFHGSGLNRLPQRRKRTDGRNMDNRSRTPEDTLIMQAIMPLMSTFMSEVIKIHISGLSTVSENSTSAYGMALYRIVLQLGISSGNFQHVGVDGDVNVILNIYDLVFYGSFHEEQAFPSILV